MQTLHSNLHLDQFFQQVRSAPQRVLMLDYDGTLAPFQAQRHQATPYPGVQEVLTRILATRTTRLVVISGRAIGGLRSLLRVSPMPELWGSHGCERWWPDGTYQLVKLTEPAREGLRQAYDWAEQMGIAAQCERKPTSLAWHWRGLETWTIAERRPMVEEHWSAIGRAGGLTVHPFDGGLELRSREYTKGRAVEAVLAEAGADAVAAYLGDDLTDEDAFLSIANRGLGVLVRPELRSTAASVWLRPPEEVLVFLRAWLRASSP